VQTIGRYHVDALIARGGMGEVYRGRVLGAHGFERPIVIKVIREDLVDSAKIAMMFIDEARIAAGLHHRNIVQILDFDRLETGGVFLVTELVEGCDLGALNRSLEAPLSYSVAVTIVAELATGLAAAHDATDADGIPLQLVHRDVSPSNVLLGIHGEVKVADFGVARTRSRSYHTVSNTIKGKASYMAPEQIRGGVLDRRADVFSLGVLLFELTTRSRLYPGSGGAAMEKILAGAVPDPVERRPDYPSRLTAIVHRALAADAGARYPTATALVDDLDELARASGWSLSLAAVGEHVRAVREHGHLTPTPERRA
jgi:eukaryotic-like serine/threonine-protein kinase